MNLDVTQALFKDALYQVLDNKVFRLLVVLVIVMVLPTFLVAAREDELVILFGWRSYFYADIFAAFGIPFPGLEGANEQLIQVVQTALVDNLAGTFGIVFAIAATAFFLPRMIEKGAADTVFSKPVSRLTLMLSRYFAGLLFVSILAVLLVSGMHLGLLLNSGYSDPGFLWSIGTLIYLFALLHAFSIAVGVLTRSTVAAILLSLMFFAFCGCVHGGWQARQFFVEVVQPKMVKSGDDAPGPEGETMQAVTGGLFAALDTLHYVLPKTTDAGVIAEKLRREVELAGTAFYDEATGLEALVAPEGFRLVEPPADAPSERVAQWRAASPGAAEARIVVESWRWEDKRRKAALTELESRLTGAGIEWSRDNVRMGDLSANLREWSESTEGVERQHSAYFFYGQGRLFVLEISGPRAWLAEQERPIKAFLASLTFRHDDDDVNPFTHYARRADWDAPLKYNLWFSIGSSVIFALLMLALGWARLARIDF